MSTNDSKKSAVPKFASFKPKPTPSEAVSELSSKAVEARHEDAPKHRHRHRHEIKDDNRQHARSQGRRSERRRSRSADRHKSRSAAQPVSTRTGGSSEESLFTIDKRGDPLIVRYGSNDRNRIPAYRRLGAGKVLGAHGRMTIIRDGPKEMFSLGGGREGASAFRDRTYLAKVLRNKPRQFKHRPKAEDVHSRDADDEFLPLKQSRKRKRGRDEPGVSSDEEQPNYRSIYGKTKNNEGSDSDLDDSSATSSQDEDDGEIQDPIRAKFIELSRHVKDHPEDINSWLELAQVQESVLRLGEVGDDQTRDGAKGLANVKLSLYEEALPHAQSDLDRETVLLRLMREGSRVWSSKALAKRWAEVTEGNPRSFALWKGRLNFELTNLSTFTHDDIKKYHLERLQFLRQQLLVEETTVDNRVVHLCDELVYVFLRTTRFLYDAGFTELAVAAWQAIIEMTFARSMQADTSTIDEELDSFRDFWESEVPRIGEDNAKGWRHFAEAEAMTDLPEPQTDEAPKAPETRDAYKAWASFEGTQTRNGKMPARTLDEGTEDDPYRVVMYSDIEPLLFYVPSSALSYTKAPLLDAFLLFCGMPPIGLSDLIKSAYNDPFVFRGGKAAETELMVHAMQTSCEPEDLSKRMPPFSHDGSHITISPEVLFAGTHWFNYIVDWASLYGMDDEPLKYEWVVKTVRQVALTFGFVQAAEYSLALSWTKDHKSSKKNAKALLKQYHSNIRLYIGYALAEWENGNQEIARNVFLSATGLQTADENDKQLLWNVWAWKELEAGRHQRALSCLVSSIEESQSQGSLQNDLSEPPSSAQVLKTKQKFLARRDYSLSSGNVDHCGLFAESLVLLEYLTAEGGTESKSQGQGNISTAIGGMLAFSDELVSRRFAVHTAHERLLQFGARLLYFHASHGPFRPIYLREQLLKLIALFPQNTMFLALFAWAESSLRIDDPVRDVLRRTVLVNSQDCPTSRIFAITHENHVGNSHSTRAAFESALESEACAGSVSLWISYIRFCYSRKELRQKAKDMFYRAVGSCPWSKELAMEAFTTLVKVMESSELRVIFNTMTSKGLRVHVDLEEFLAKWSQAQQPPQVRAR